MPEHSKSDPPLWIQSRDKRGRPIDPKVLDAAQRNWGRVLEYVRRELQDAPRAAEILERVVHSVSNAMRRNFHRQRVKDLDAYLYWAFTRKVRKIVARERMIQYVAFSEDLVPLETAQDSKWVHKIEDEILLKQLLGYLEERPRGMVLLRAGGYSWKEVARALGISVNNALVQFNHAIEKSRKLVGKAWPKGRSPSQ